MATAKEPLKKIAGYSQGVRTTTSLRMITMARPICPHSKITMELDDRGRPVPIKRPGEPNCQLLGRGWWDHCQEAGHDPYYTVYKWYTTEDIIELDEQGRMVKKGEQLFPHEDRRLNVAQVASAININNGKGPIEAIQNKGFKMLSDLGYEEVCQYRNCQKAVTPEGTSRKYGRYCSKEHLALIGVTVEELAIPVVETRLGGFDTTKAVKKRDRQQAEVLLGA